MADRDSDSKDLGRPSLNDSDIETVRLKARRSFLRTIGVTALSASAVVLGVTAPRRAQAADTDSNDSKKSHDFPKRANDGDTTRNADLKTADSDDRNSKAVDSDQSRLRDVKGSSDSD